MLGGMPYRQHRLDPQYPGPEVVTTKSGAPPVVVDIWCDLVARMDRRTLDRFTKDIWARFDSADLEPLKRAILRRRDDLRRGTAAPQDRTESNREESLASSRVTLDHDSRAMSLPPNVRPDQLSDQAGLRAAMKDRTASPAESTTASMSSSERGCGLNAANNWNNSGAVNASCAAASREGGSGVCSARSASTRNDLA